MIGTTGEDPPLRKALELACSQPRESESKMVFRLLELDAYQQIASPPGIAVPYP